MTAPGRSSRLIDDIASLFGDALDRLAKSESCRDNLTRLALLAISSRPPSEDQAALEVPEIERRRAGLSEWKSAWITFSEYNYDIAERSWHLDVNQAPLGRFSKSFLIGLASSLAPLFRTAQARVHRTE